MKIKEVQIDGFGVWSGLTVDTMPDGMTVFYGPNEAGKTTLMQFLRTMFYGFTAERRKRYLPPVYGGKSGGAMRVTGPGGGYEISRRAQLNDPSVVGQLTVTGSDGIVQGAHRMAMLLGQIDESIFTNVFAIGLRELQELSTLDDTAAADELYKLSSGLDRVSLVDVIRQLKNARSQIAGPTPDVGQIQGMMMRREKLRDEEDQLSARGRRWSELAAQRRSHQNEIDELKQRVDLWELEAKTLETAMQVRQPWQERDKHRSNLLELNARIDLPDDAGDRLRHLQAQLEDRKARIQAIMDQRRGVRARAGQLPVRKNILELASKIDAAAEQAPWIGSLQKQIQRLESQVRQSAEQLIEDAIRLGLSEEDQNSLLQDKRLANMPDLSRQAISQLAGPAREVRVQAIRMKQAKAQGENDRKEAERLAAQINEVLSTRDQTELHQAMQRQSDLINTLRKHQSVYERLEKLAKHRKDIEGEAIHLASDEALPADRILLLAIPFIFGGYMLIAGLGKFLSLWFVTNKDSDASVGMMMMLIGIIAIFAWFTWRKLTERGTTGDLDDVESQLDALVRQIKKTEQERDEIERALPTHSGSVEQRLKEAEHELGVLEGLLPVHHNHEAATQRFQMARKRASSAAELLKSAKAEWAKTLKQLGLAISLSPKSIRIMAEGYESLVQSRQRLKTQEDELAQRKLELASIQQRIEGLARQAAIAFADDNNAESRIDGGSRPIASTVSTRRDDRRTHNRNAHDRRQDSTFDLNEDRPQLQRKPTDVEEPAEGAVVRLQELTGILAEQQQYIQQRRALKEEDAQLRKQQRAVQATIDKLVRSRQALLAELGVEGQEQLEDHLKLKREHFRLVALIDELDSRVRAIIGGNVPYDSIVRLLESPNSNDLEKRWDALQERIQQSEQRVLHLHQRQGETAQEMRSLAADRRLSEVKLELACIDKQIKACAEHWQILAATTCMLEKVCEVYETERQPETLRESSAFLKQLTDGKYVRVWTPLGKNALRVDNENGQSLPLEVLSRGTREAVFIALRLSLAAAYARRGVTLPLVLDDVLVNFDSHRAKGAARVLREFADLGHQVVMFTCHEHIMRMFHEIDVQVRVLPPQGHPGDAKVYLPEVQAFLPMHAPITDEMVESQIEEPATVAVESVAPQLVQDAVEITSELPAPEFAPDSKPSVAVIPTIPSGMKRQRPEPIQASDTMPDHLWYELDPIEAIWNELEDFPHPKDFDSQAIPNIWWHGSPVP